MDQGGSVPLVHIAAFDWPSLPSSPHPASGRHSRDRWAGATCELNATRRLTLTARQCGRSRPYARGIWLKWRRYEWSGHDGGSLRLRTLVVVFDRYTDLLRADMGGAYYT